MFLPGGYNWVQMPRVDVGQSEPGRKTVGLWLTSQEWTWRASDDLDSDCMVSLLLRKPDVTT